MRETPRKDVTDSVSWACPQCKTRKSVREGSFFKDSRLSLKQWLMIMYWWARQYPVTDAAEEAHVNSGAAVDAYQWLREVCSPGCWALMSNWVDKAPLSRSMKACFGTSPKYTLQCAYPQEILRYSLSLFSSTTTVSVMLPTQCGYWDGGHLGAASVGLHGSGSSEERCYAAAHHRGPRTSGHHSAQRRVDCIQLCCGASRGGRPCHCEPLCGVCVPWWCPHPERAVILEPCQD